MSFEQQRRRRMARAEWGIPDGAVLSRSNAARNISQDFLLARAVILLWLALIRAPDQLESSDNSGSIEVFLAGDVMTGRGIDQILAHPGNPELFEGWVKDARTYVRLAEEKNGPIPRVVPPDYIWGAAMDIWACRNPDLRIINLETSVTTSDDHWPRKGIHYRMHPKNIDVLTKAGIDCCVLANNHVMDWGVSGLLETLDTLQAAGIKTAGAGRNSSEAWEPAIFAVQGKRVLVFAFGVDSAGVPPQWAAGSERAGVAYLPDLLHSSLQFLKDMIDKHRDRGDHVIVSIHWGGNWGHQVPLAHREFSCSLVDEVDVDVVYGHSSHHPRPLEQHNGGLILYGCGDLINDYEGISGHESYRSELTLMYFAKINLDGEKSVDCEMYPLRMQRFQLRNASGEETAWIADTLKRECKRFDMRMGKSATDTLLLVPIVGRQ